MTSRPGAGDPRELQNRAERLIRAQGNLSGRGRLRADLTQRPTMPPRGVLVVTGEGHPAGSSLVARLVLVDVEEGSVDVGRLTAMQATASRLPHALAGYIGWLAPQMPTISDRLRAEFLADRNRTGGQEMHRRIPENVTHLGLGLRTYLRFAEAIGACSPALTQGLWQRSETALADLVARQGQGLDAERPVPRFLRGLLALLSTQAAVLVDTLATGADEPTTMLGWADPEWLYLIPEAAFRAVSRFYRDAGEPYPLRQVRLFQELAEAKLSDCTEGRHTRTWRIGGKSRRVLKLDRQAVETLLGEDFPEPWKPPPPPSDGGFP